MEEEHAVAMEEAKEQGIEKAMEKTVRNLLFTQKITDKEISDFLKVEESLVRKIKKKYQ